MAQSQHGYQINEFIEKNLSRVTDMKKPTAYATLERLADSGYVERRAEQAGNRPVRKVYSITPKGSTYFFDLLRENLAAVDQLNFASDIGMMFLDHLPPSESLPLLEHRLAQLETQIAIYQSAPAHGFGFGVDFAMEHHRVHLEADHTWLHSVIERIRIQHTDG